MWLCVRVHVHTYILKMHARPSFVKGSKGQRTFGRTLRPCPVSLQKDRGSADLNNASSISPVPSGVWTWTYRLYTLLLKPRSCIRCPREHLASSAHVPDYKAEPRGRLWARAGASRCAALQHLSDAQRGSRELGRTAWLPGRGC